MGQPTGETGTTTPPAGGQDNQQQNPAPAQTSNTAAGSSGTFSQEDLDRIVSERLAREKAKYADYDTLKERASQWDTFVEESKTDAQKALDQAKRDAETTAYQRARSEYGGKLVDAHLRAAAAGRLSDGALSALLGGVNTALFLTDTGDVDTTKITQFIDGIAPTVTPSNRPGGFGQGPREGAPKRGLEAGRAAFEARHKEGTAPPLFS